jgi:hypothetical protein
VVKQLWCRMKYARTACSFIDRVEPIRITTPPGLQLFSRSWAPFFAGARAANTSLLRAEQAAALN